MTMDIQGIAWVGNICQKFENMCLEVEEIVLEDTVKYIENQMQTVGESVKKIYSDVMQDLLPLPSGDSDEEVASELPMEQCTDAGFSEKTFQCSEKITVKADAKQTTKDSRNIRDVDNDVVHDESDDNDASFKSTSGNSVYANILGSDENQRNDKMAGSETASEITLLESDVCSTSQSSELSKENQDHDAVTVSKPDSAEVFRYNETENASSEQSSEVTKLAELDMGYSSPSVRFGDTDGLSMIKTTQPDDCSLNATFVSHPEIPEGWSVNETKIDSIINNGYNKTMQQDDELKLEGSCVMVTRVELQLAPKIGINLKTDKKKRRQPFSLLKKSARKQEYEELAMMWHRNNEKGKGDDDCVENSCQTLVEERKNQLMVPDDISESEWELL